MTPAERLDVFRRLAATLGWTIERDEDTGCMVFVRPTPGPTGPPHERGEGAALVVPQSPKYGEDQGKSVARASDKTLAALNHNIHEYLRAPGTDCGCISTSAASCCRS